MITDKPQKGAWENMEIEYKERLEKVTWQKKGEFHILTCKNEPSERDSATKDGVYYIINVVEEGKDKILMTSSWSMLKGLKVYAPIKGKTFKIMKEIEQGKQYFNVECLDTVKEEAVE